MWIDSLRDGENSRYPYYPSGRLSRLQGYNAFGIACELAIADGVELHLEHYGNGYGRYNGAEYCLPWPVKHWLGLHEITGTFMGPYDGYDSFYAWECATQPTAEQAANLLEKSFKEGLIRGRY